MSSDSFSNSSIGAMVSAFGGESPEVAGDVSKARVLEWMRLPDLEARGCIYTMIVEPGRATHIKPPLVFEDYYDFVIPYLEECIEENPNGEWAESRYLAARALATWIISFWEGGENPFRVMDEIKGRLVALYKRGDEDVRNAVVSAVLERLFEHDSLVEFFKDWQVEPNLMVAYNDALAWAKRGS